MTKEAYEERDRDKEIEEEEEEAEEKLKAVREKSRHPAKKQQSHD